MWYDSEDNILVCRLTSDPQYIIEFSPTNVTQQSFQMSSDKEDLLSETSTTETSHEPANVTSDCTESQSVLSRTFSRKKKTKTVASDMMDHMYTCRKGSMRI